MKYFFVLGNTPDLAREEVGAILPHRELFYGPPVLILETENEILFDRFGGVVKVGEIIDNNIVEFLKNSGQKSIDFGISNYGSDSGRGQNDVVNLSKEIKRELVEAGIRARFVLPKRGETTLSSVVVRKQLLTEFLLFKDLIAKTIWSQDFEDWGVRDFGRPAVDPHIGMLPPKVARMMINIARAETILDPFCGVGTILAEALTIGINAIGSDINPAQIAKTKKNLDWLGKTLPAGRQAALYVGDARNIMVPPVDAIVTEPDLGPRVGLEKLYLDSLQAWRKILNPSGKVVMATPFPIDKEKLMGYSVAAGPFPYFRPQAKVKRFIWLIQKHQA